MNESVEERTSHGSDKPASDQLLAVLRGSDVLQRSMVFSTRMLTESLSVRSPANVYLVMGRSLANRTMR